MVHPRTWSVTRPAVVLWVARFAFHPQVAVICVDAARGNTALSSIRAPRWRCQPKRALVLADVREQASVRLAHGAGHDVTRVDARQRVIASYSAT